MYEICLFSLRNAIPTNFNYRGEVSVCVCVCVYVASMPRIKILCDNKTTHDRLDNTCPW